MLLAFKLTVTERFKLKLTVLQNSKKLMVSEYQPKHLLRTNYTNIISGKKELEQFKTSNTVI